MRAHCFDIPIPFWLPTSPQYIPIEGFQRINIFFARARIGRIVNVPLL